MGTIELFGEIHLDLVATKFVQFDHAQYHVVGTTYVFS